MTERRKRDRERRRQDILDAAETVFATRGVEAATMDEIASEAEVSKGTLYLYFKSKGALIAAIAMRNAAAMKARIEAHLVHTTDGLSGIGAVLLSYVERFKSHPQRSRLILQHWASSAQLHDDVQLEPGFRETITSVMQLVTAQVVRGQKDGSIAPGLRPDALAMQLWAGFLGTWMTTQAGVPARLMGDALPEVLPTYVEVTLRGIAGPDARIEEIVGRTRAKVREALAAPAVAVHAALDSAYSSTGAPTDGVAPRTSSPPPSRVGGLSEAPETRLEDPS